MADTALITGASSGIGYCAMMQANLVVIDDWKLRLLNWVVPLLPRKLVLRMSKQAMEKQ
ncbi:MAG: hypothetical protein ACR2NM_02665 [Bythopirellula sp.]